MSLHESTSSHVAPGFGRFLISLTGLVLLFFVLWGGLAAAVAFEQQRVRPPSLTASANGPQLRGLDSSPHPLPQGER